MEVPPFDDFIFLPAVRILLKYMQLTALEKNIQWPQPISPSSFHFPTAEKVGNRAAETKRLAYEDKLLTQLLLELQLPDQAIRGVGSKSRSGMPVEEILPPQQEIFLQIMRPHWWKKQLSVTAVVMAQILLVINRDCGSKLPRFYGQLYTRKSTRASP